MEQSRPIPTPMDGEFQVKDDPINDKVPYHRLVCSLLVFVISRPDLSFSVLSLSRYLDKPTDHLWKAAKHVVRDLSSTKDEGLCFKKGPPDSISYADADWAGDQASGKSISGFIAFHSSNLIAWFSKVFRLDHTYKVDKNRRPVTLMITMDGHGDGRSVGYAFVANEKAATIEYVLGAFKPAIGDEVAHGITTVIDYSDIKAISNVLPAVRIQLCDFHVSKTFQKKACKEPETVKKIWQEMGVCSGNKEFSSLVDELHQTTTANFWKLALLRNGLVLQTGSTFNLGNCANHRMENHKLFAFLPYDLKNTALIKAELQKLNIQFYMAALCRRLAQRVVILCIV